MGSSSTQGELVNPDHALPSHHHNAGLPHCLSAFDALTVRHNMFGIGKWMDAVLARIGGLERGMGTCFGLQVAASAVAPQRIDPGNDSLVEHRSMELQLHPRFVAPPA